MNINRDNYEEYFLLYADNELSAEEKSAVEIFVEQNPDLEEELLVIKLSVNNPDKDCVLEDKSFLFREPGKFISDSNYEEVFILYNDNELTNYQRKETEAFLQHNPTFKNDFELLKKSKLEADNAIGFPNKKLLYKNEDNGKVVPFRWWKAAAAAVLLGVGLWVAMPYLKTDKKSIQSTVSNNPANKTNTNRTLSNNSKSVEPANVVAENKEAKTPKQKLIVKRSINKPSMRKTQLPDDLPVVKSELPSNNLPHSVIINNIGKEESKLETQNVINPVKKNIGDEDVVNKTKDEDVVTNKDETASKAITTSFALDENEKSNNYAFYNIPQEKFNRSKLGGFLRKVKRIIERKISPFNNTKDKNEIAVN